MSVLPANKFFSLTFFQFFFFPLDREIKKPKNQGLPWWRSG